MHKIKISNIKNHIEELSLRDGSYTIGRSMESSIRLESNEVSRTHARLLISNNNCEIIDNNSTNGTYINGKRSAFHRLTNGDIIGIGKFNLEFHTSRLTEESAPPVIQRIRKRNYFPILILSAVLFFFIILAYLFFSLQWKADASILQKRLVYTTAAYLAEKNKEALYLDDLSSINISDLPQEIRQIAILDRHNKICAYSPEGSQPDIDTDFINSIKISKLDKKTFEVYAPIYYDKIKVGTLWLIYNASSAVSAHEKL